MTTTEAVVAIVFLLVVAAMFLAHCWLSFRVHRYLTNQNFRLMQANLGLSGRESALPIALNAETTRQNEIAAERDAAVAANGQSLNGSVSQRRRIMES